MSSFQRVIKYCAMAFAIFLAVTIISGIVSVVVTVVSAVSGDSIFNNNKEKINYEENFTDVTSLDIDINTGQLIIMSGDTFRVEAENVTKDFQTKVSDNGTLIIDESKNNVHFFGFNFNGFNNTNSKITLYLPATFISKDTEINTGAGKVTIEKLDTESLLISTGAGNISGNNINAEEVKIDGGVGNTDFEEVSFKNADFNCGVGNLNIKGELLGDNTIDCGVGEVKLELTGNVDDYQLNIDSGVGTVRVNGEKIKDSYQNNNRADNSIEVDGGVGNVRIDFMN